MTTKTEQTKAIIAANPGLARKEMLLKLQAEAGLTANGAATYYQKWKNAANVAQAVEAYEAKVLEVTKMSNKELVDTFNANGGNVKRFADRQSGLKRLMALLTEKNIKFA